MKDGRYLLKVAPIFCACITVKKLGDRPGIKFEEASLTRPDRSNPVVSGDAADLKFLGANLEQFKFTRILDKFQRIPAR